MERLAGNALEGLLFLDRKPGKQENRSMKTTLDLPEALLKAGELRAAREGTNIKDLIAELLRRGLAAKSQASALIAPEIVKDKRTGLPLIIGKHPASPGEELTPERVAEILLAQEVKWHEDAGR